MKTNETLKLIGDKEFLDKIYQFSYRRCNTSTEAEDLCSDIILAVISAVHNQESIENFYAFVWTIARRVYADYSEKRNLTRQTISIENGDLLLATKENEIDCFIEEATEQEQIKKIFSEISFLSKAYREVMVMYYIDEMKVKDIALKLGISETTVKQRLFSARNTVRKEVETMSERNLSLKPIRLAIAGTGNPVGNDPRTKTERILSQNLVYLCKDKAKTAKELSEELCVPMPFIEDELEILCYGENGKYGMLRKLDNRKYISNILIVDYNEYDEANNIYESHLKEYCDILKSNFKKQKENMLLFPYFSKQHDASFIMWSLISRTIWDFEETIKKHISHKHFKDVEPSKRPFTCVAVAYRDEEQPHFGFYGCDGNNATSVGGYKTVYVSNIYGARIDKHFACGHNIAQDEKLLMTIRACDGKLFIDELSDIEKEVAAKCIECGYLRKSGKQLLPKMVALEMKYMEDFHSLSYSLNEGTDTLAETIADELSLYMKKHIPEHLINDYEFYTGCIAGVRLLADVIEECITEGLLSVPENRIGAEGMILMLDM